MDGVDLWDRSDLVDNGVDKVQKNIDDNHFSDRAKVITADMLELPFKNNIYDYISASYSIHTLKAEDKKTAAI